MARGAGTAGPRGSVRLRVWRAGLRAAPARFARPPEPRSIGEVQTGRDLCTGHMRLGADRVAIDTGPWTPVLSAPLAEADRHGFAWLDDLAALGTRRAADLARAWTAEWLARYGTGGGPGWAPHIAGRRFLRFVHHGTMLTDRAAEADATRFRSSLTRHLRYLSAHWRSAPPGVPTFEALCGNLVGALALEGGERVARPALAALERLCRADIPADGSVPSRNPEELAELFALLVWTDMALADAGLVAQPAHRAAIARMAPVLRALRHADGALARFHGGGQGVTGRLDGVLAAARVRGLADFGAAMGYARLARGRVTVIVDAAAPPAAAAPHTAHASTLALQVTAGRRPLIVSCGDGRGFGAEWAAAARATPAHSTFGPLDLSSSRFEAAPGGALRLTQPAPDVRLRPVPERGPVTLEASHAGFVKSYGLWHVRRLALSEDGAVLTGEEVLSARTRAERARFAAQALTQGPGAVPMALRFHLHPDVTAHLVPDAPEVEIMLKSGELWRFRCESPGRIRLDPSVYLEKTEPQPVPARQILVEIAAVAPAIEIRWRLSRFQTERRMRS